MTTQLQNREEKVQQTIEGADENFGNSHFGDVVFFPTDRRQYIVCSCAQNGRMNVWISVGSRQLVRCHPSRLSRLINRIKCELTCSSSPPSCPRYRT